MKMSGSAPAADKLGIEISSSPPIVVKCFQRILVIGNNSQESRSSETLKDLMIMTYLRLAGSCCLPLEKELTIKQLVNEIWHSNCFKDSRLVFFFLKDLRKKSAELVCWRMVV